MGIDLILENTFRLLVTGGFPIALLFVMAQFKCKRRTAWFFLVGLFLASTAINISMLVFFSSERMKQFFALILLVPSLVFLLFTTRDKPSQLLFNAFTTINAVYFVSILSHFAVGGLSDDSKLIWLDALVRALLLSLIFFLFSRFLREPYQFLARHMKAGSWRVLSVVPVLFFGLVMYLGLYPHVRTDNLNSVVFLYIILCFVYFIIYQVFRNTYDLIQQQKDNELLKTQVLSLYHQVGAIRRSEEQVRLYRHDMRHYTENIAALLRDGNIQEALQCVDQLHGKSMEPQTAHYCQNVTINAILGTYLRQAQEDGITVSVDCDLPEDLPCDALALATVFANAIENARHACQALPEGADRRLEVRCLNVAQIVIEISNTFDGMVQFDQNHYPVTRAKGHGLGTKSILAFAQANDAYLDYKVENGMFRLRLLINKPM